MIIKNSNIKNALFHLKAYGFSSMVRKTLYYIEFHKSYNIWSRKHILSYQVLEDQNKHIFSYQPKISIIVPVYKTPEPFLRQMIDSVVNQTYSNWELCIADGSTDKSASYITDIVTEYQQIYPSIQYKLLAKNRGISGNTNAALSLASGDYIALLDHDDLLAPDTLFEIVKVLNQNPEVDILYTDEDKVDINLKKYYDPYFKPDFNLDLLRSCNYITHFFTVRKSLADAVGGFDEECNGSQDYDFILKTCDKANHIYHIPKILYHWRIHPASVAGDPESKSYAYDAAVHALQKHLIRCNEIASVSKDAQFGYYKIKYSYTGTPLVSILIKECTPDLIRQIKSITTYTNYEIIDSADKASGDYLIVLYRIKQILTSDWIEQFLGNCNRQTVGIVGSRICTSKTRVAEAGLLFTSDGQLHSPFNGFHISDTGYCHRAHVQQNCSFIGPYCFMIKTKVYQQYWNNENDVNFEYSFYRLCESLRNNNYLIVMIPFVDAIRIGKKERLPILDYCVGKKDPYYNQNFSEKQIYHLL